MNALCLFLVHTFPRMMNTVPDSIRVSRTILVPWSISLAFFIALPAGRVFGFYPARRAAAMNHIEALRDE